MKKFKEFSKKYLIGFMLGIISGSIVIAYAQTYFSSNDVIYDNSNSGLSSTNVQGAIDELYNVCFPPTPAGDQILEQVDVVTSGDGLYKDAYEDGRYFYKGKNVKNYVTFNNETAGWRIISINSDGTIKIMRDVSIGNMAWDSSTYLGNNNWNRPADLNTYLNGEYYNSLTSTAQSQIVDGTYNAGGITYDNNDMQNQINEEKSVISKVKIALPTVSEYIRANSNKNQCGTLSSNSDNTKTCINSNWMYIDDYWWLLSPYFGGSDTVFFVDSIGGISGNWPDAMLSAVRPTVTLSSEVQIIGGDGSQSNPFIIE